MRRNVCSIVNPFAGKGLTAKELNRLKTLIMTAFPDSEILVPEKEDKTASRLARMVQDRGTEELHVYGGDGTVNEVINGLKPYSTQPKVGVVPIGTANEFALSGLGMHRNIKQSISILETGFSIVIDLGQANGSLFANTASLGIDADINRCALPLKPFFRKCLRLPILAYAPAILRVLVARKRFPTITVVIDSQELPCGKVTMLTVTNSKSYAAGLQISPDAKLDDGLLDLCLLRETKNLALLQRALEVVLRTHTKRKDKFVLRQFFRLQAVSQEPLPLQLDGEDYGTTDQVDIVVVPKALRVIANERLIPSPLPKEDGSFFIHKKNPLIF